jgi:hypothetical protein
MLPRMKTLPHWTNLLPLLGASLAYYLGLGWLKANRTAANLAECGHPPRRVWAEIPTEEWCPAHDQWYAAEGECSGCHDEWESTWTLGEDPAELARRDDWVDRMAERWDAEHEGESDGWYRDLAARAEYPGFDPHDGRRVD